MSVEVFQMVMWLSENGKDSIGPDYFWSNFVEIIATS